MITTSLILMNDGYFHFILSTGVQQYHLVTLRELNDKNS